MLVRKLVFVLLLVVHIPACLKSQAPIVYYDEISDRNELNISSNRGLILVQDRKGFIWIAGVNGLQRFDGYEFTDYNNLFGYTVVTGLMEDSKGILWISCLNGLYLFDPETERFVHFLKDPEMAATYEVIEDRRGIIWCAYANGLERFEPKLTEADKLKELVFKKGLTSAYITSFFRKIAADTSRSSEQIWDIQIDSQNRLWIGSTEGLFYFDPQSLTFVRMDDDVNGNTRLLNRAVYSIREKNPDELWIGSENGIARLSNLQKGFAGAVPDKLKIKLENYRFNNGSSNPSSIVQLFFDSKQNLWAGSNTNGLTRVTIRNGQKPEFEDVIKTLQGSFTSQENLVRSIIEDQSGLLWMSYEFPLIRRIRTGKKVFIPLPEILESNYKVRYDFNQILRDRNGHLWICTWGTGLFEIDRNRNVKNYMNTDPGNSWANLTVSLLEPEDGIFWIGTLRGIYQLNVHTGVWKKQFESTIPQTMIDRMIGLGNYIIINGIGNAYAQNGLWVYNKHTHEMVDQLQEILRKSGTSSIFINGYNISEKGEIWFYNREHGLVKSSFDQNSGNFRFNYFPEQVNRKLQQSLEGNDQITDFYEDKTGHLWMYTAGLLLELNKQNGDIRKWTEQDGLQELTKSGLDIFDEDLSGNLWLVGTHKIYRLDPNTGKINIFDQFDGLPDLKHSPRCMFKDATGQFYLGGWGNLYSFNPESLYRSEIKPPVVITGFKLANKPVKVGLSGKPVLTRNIAYTHNLDLAWNQNDLSFTFAALDYNDPAHNRYAYKLEGYQNEWIHSVAGNRTAAYTNLNPGKYVFRVKGSNYQGVWNDAGTVINITIRPPLWKTIWAYIAYSVLFLLLLRVYIYWKTGQLRKEKAGLEEKVSERTRQIEHQKEELLQQKEELQSILENLQRTQEQLIESEKMAALGGLVAGIAHEINTPVGIGVTAVSNLHEEIQKMASMFKKDEINRREFKEFLESANDAALLIQKNLERTASLIQSFKQVSVDQVSEKQRMFNLKAYLHDIIHSLSPRYKNHDIAINLDCDDRLELNSYPGAFAQIFTNLLMNSCTHGFHDCEKGTINIRVIPENQNLRIEYRDDGQGISKKDLPHIFEPFYTSDQRRGTGLGLNIVYNLVKQKLQGNISCESEPGKGVLFTVTIPV
jgi:signal transduction histidine kinase/ligand-binding sensor domain-containing protein